MALLLLVNPTPQTFFQRAGIETLEHAV